MLFCTSMVRWGLQEVSMRRAFFFVVFLFVLAWPARAQIGKQPMVRAGSPEDRALREIDAATDPATKLELLDKFLADYGQGEMALLAYERYVAHFVSVKDYDKVFAYSEKALTIDPDNFSFAYTLVTAAAEKGDAAKTFDYGERVAGILERYRAAPPPEGTDAATWEERKNSTLAGLADRIDYVHRLLLGLVNQAADLGTKLLLVDRYLKAFPASPYLNNAQVMMAALWILQADSWSERGEQLDKAQEYATKAIDLLNRAQKPQQLTDEQWTQQKSLQLGLAYSALGQVHVNKNRNSQAIEAFRTASPLLKADPANYGRNLYRLGFTLAKMKRIPEARTVLTEAVAVNSPYRALAQDTLNKIGGPVAKAPAKKRP